MFGWRRLVERKLDAALLLLERIDTAMIKLDDLIASLNDNTNAVAARLDKLSAEIAAAGQAPTDAQMAELQAISDHLKTLGADPANPVPAPAPVAPAPATTSTPSS